MSGRGSRKRARRGAALALPAVVLAIVFAIVLAIVPAAELGAQAVSRASETASSAELGRTERVRIETPLGSIVAEIYTEAAPVTAENFLAYVDDALFDGGSFFRVVRMDNQPNDSVRIEVIQGGPDGPAVRDRLRPPIALERTRDTGLRHTDGALSMARGGPDSARSQFFICIGDQPSLDFGGNRNLDGQGFAVFGRVVEGMDVVRRIQQGATEGQRLVDPVEIEAIRRSSTSPGTAETSEAPGPASIDAAARRVSDFVTALVSDAPMPGMTVGVAWPDGSSSAFVAGVADTVTGRPLRPGDRMLQGSVGKTYFGAVALQLVAEEKLGLDDRLSSYLGHEPWYADLPNGEAVTIRQLMSHTSGIVRYELNPAFLADLKAEPYRSFSPEERLAYLAGSEPPFEAGEGWEYSDTNYILLAMVIEAVTGRSAYDEIRRRLLVPLALNETVASDRPEVPGLVNGYAGPANPFGAYDATMPEGARLAFNPQFEWGGGGFAGSTRDLALWIQHVHEGRAFPPSLLDAARNGTPAPLGPEASYGLGVIMMELGAGTAWGHSGFMPGYRTEAYYFPDHGVAIALQINTTDPGALPRSPLRILDEIARQLFAALEDGP